MLMPEAPNKDQKSRLGFYIDWLVCPLAAPGITPDLSAYRDYLLFQRVAS